MKRKASKEKKQLLENDNWPRVWILGQNAKLAPELKKMAREIALSESKDHVVDGWKVRVRHVVRGHWKNQAHGEGFALHTRKWIFPYWRGPEGGAAWAHLYEAKS